MFGTIVFVLLMLLLVMSSGAAIHMALFKGHRRETGFAKKVIGGFVSYLLSGTAWLFMYSYTFLGW
ncbi:MAG: hypothetical protein HY879_17145 [Deltaproteobacteria bacterium]|nr:hypothetical protein [Deltaproteobacteria bacterium]